MNYWLLLAIPDNFYCEACSDNAKVNDFLYDLEKSGWYVPKEDLSDIQVGDKIVLVLGQDSRSIENRTLASGEVKDVLESGIYGIGKVTTGLKVVEDGRYIIEITINKNLFKENSIIDIETTEKILGYSYLTSKNPKIDKNQYDLILSTIEINDNSQLQEIEGDSGIEPNSLDEDNTVYPAEVKIQRDMYSVRELKTDYEEEMLVLAPAFQREFVWKLKQKSELIESILMGIPLPMIYFFEGEGGVIQVVDGKQRLTSLFEFIDDKYPLSHTLSILKNLRGKKYSELSASERTKIARHQFVTQTIIPPTPDKIKFDIFERVNRKGTTLNNQEMRNALYQGKATKLLEDLSKYESFKNATGNAISPARMKDRYMILRFLAFYLWKNNSLLDKNGELVEYKSDIDEFLGKTMDFINNSSDEAVAELTQIFNVTMQRIYKNRGKDAFRIPRKERKRPINMALMESLGYLFSQFDNIENFNSINPSIDNLLKDDSFLISLTERVDSSVSVKIRFDKMDEILGINR